MHLQSVRDGPARAAGSAGRLLAAAGAGSGLAALVAAWACCLLPIGLGTRGAGASIVVALDGLVPWRWPLLGVSVVVVALGWLAHLRERAAARAAGYACTNGGRRLTPLLLGLATVPMALAAGWDALQPVVLGWLEPVAS
ncbi:mercury transporter MerT [Chelatococcus sp. SYSU_G07232]|uniref:Mercury transporter MerT n=1 Tax=Chelatococcus albus TaxID=3047466 RepID=A0ABT7AJG1_9HYPH|nr:mercury transporter MerT [Chelatococcus sp. SYSU_G07232]MDJ1159515.1 mercury transporter MerT [Chelatococcus sp. SYSU_G07232]